MSLLIRPHRRHSNPPLTTSTETAPVRAAREAEAPDRGVEETHREAPESGRVKIAEAPDAGEGRSAHVEHEFTHGRSQS